MAEIRSKIGQKRSCVATPAVLLLYQKLIDRQYQSNPIPTEKTNQQSLKADRPVSFCKKSGIQRKNQSPISVNFFFSYNPFEKTRVWRNETTDVNFYQKQESWYQVRRFNFSINYKFGKLKEGIAKKKRGIQNDDVKGRESSGGGGIN